MSYCKHCRMLSYYKCGGNMEPPRHVHPIAEWCILGIEVYCGTGQLSFLSPRGGKYIEIPRGVRNRHGVLSFGGTYMEVSFDADVAAEHGVRAAVVLNHIAHLMRFPDGSQAGHFKTCGRAYVHVSPEYLWKLFPFMSLRQATEALRELREGGLIAEREYWRSRPRLPQLVHVDRDGKRRRMTAPIKAPARKENIYGGSS
ncbi:Uncharacterised protein [uncultured Clostridium sp.]|nr:Uncharacterised protein [uncultured Clostridium sp.]